MDLISAAHSYVSLDELFTHVLQLLKQSSGG